MTPSVFVFCLMCLFLGKTAQMTKLKSSSSGHQESGFVSAHVGDEVTLQCVYEGDIAARLHWYKQPVGKKPRLISTFYKYNVNITFHEEFKDDPRVTLKTENGENHLTIKNLHISDSATYYCASGYSYVYTFLETVTLSVEGSGVNVQAVVHQSASETIQPGGSVTLNCTVHTGTCDGEHRVYWFRDSEQSHPGLIYTHGGSSDQCERKPETQTHSCVYNLPMKSLNLSHAGTYYCAVASCGHILFGNGTKLDFEDEAHSPALVYFLSGAFASTTILTVLLVFLVCIRSKTHSCPCIDSPATLLSSSNTYAKAYESGDNLCYIALRAIEITRSKQRDDTWSDCVYINVKL